MYRQLPVIALNEWEKYNSQKYSFFYLWAYILLKQMKKKIIGEWIKQIAETKLEQKQIFLINIHFCIYQMMGGSTVYSMVYKIYIGGRNSLKGLHTNF